MSTGNPFNPSNLVAKYLGTDFDNIVAVKDKLPELLRLNDYLIQLMRTYDSIDNVDTVAVNIDDVNTVALNIDEIVTIATEVGELLTRAQEETLPLGSKIYPRLGYLENEQEVTAETTHLRVLVGGKPTIVAMSPVTSGVVSLLTETSATIGVTTVTFSAPLMANFNSVSDMLAQISNLPVGGMYSIQSTILKRISSSNGTLDDFVALNEINSKAFSSINDGMVFSGGKKPLHVDADTVFPDEVTYLRKFGLKSDYPGSYTGETGTNYLSVSQPIRAGYENDDVNDRGDFLGSNPSLLGLSFSSSDNTQPTHINNGGHFQRIENASFRGNKDSGVPHIRLGATLYNNVSNVDIGGASGDGLRGVESDFDATYYGVNASWFEKLNVNIPGTAVQLHGIFSFRDSTIENTQGEGKPRFIIGEDGGSTSAMTVLDHMYFECTTAAGNITAPLIEIKSNSNISVQDSVLSNQAGANPSSINPTCIYSSHTLSGSYRFNHNQIRPVPNTVGDPENLGRGIDIVTASRDYYIEMIGNDWASGSSHPADEMIMINGVSVKNLASTQSVYTTGRIYIRDEEHGEVRQNLPSRDIWCNHYREVDANNWKLSGGRNLVLTYVPTTDVTVETPEVWKGARFTMHFYVGCTLKHGSGFFYLAAGVDTAIPAGSVIDFTVDFQGNVREVGTSTIILQP